MCPWLAQPQETELAQKVAKVREQLLHGQAGIFFYPGDESFQILPRDQFPEEKTYSG